MTMTIRNSDKIRFGLVGCGRVSRNHFRAFQAFPEDCVLTAACDIHEGRLQAAVEQTGATGYLDYQAMLDREDLDAISICTPSGMHPEHGIAAAIRKINVITEKPMAIRIADGDRLIAECDRRKVHLFVVKQNRLNRPMQLLKKALEQGRFGRLYGIYINVFWQRPQSYYDQASWRGTWQYDGGAFMNQASHYVDAAQWLFGEVESVCAITATQARKIEAEDSGSAILMFRNGAIGSLNVSMLTFPKDREGSLTVLGENGTVKIGGVALNRVESWEFADQAEGDHEVRAADYEPPNVYGFGHTAYYRNVIRTLKGQAEANTDGRAGRKSLELILAIYESGKTGRRITLPVA